MKSVRIAVALLLAAGGLLGFAGPAVAGPVQFPPEEPGTFSTLAFPGAAQTMPAEITDSGLIVGCFGYKTGPQRGFTDRAGKFTAVTGTSIGKGRRTSVCLAGANSKGMIVGQYTLTSGVSHGFLDAYGKITVITDPAAGRASGEGTFAVDINDSGIIVGWYVNASQDMLGFVLKGGKFTTIRHPAVGGKPVMSTILNGVADDGEMSGGYTTASSVLHGFLYRNGTYTEIKVPDAPQTPGGGTEASCISKHSGLVVGIYFKSASANPVGFSYQGGRYHTISDPAAVRGTDPQCGNDAGKIVGFYFGRTGGARGFVFTPTS